MKKSAFPALFLILACPVAQATELLLNGSFNDKSAWTVVPAESPSWTCIANGEANLHPVVPTPPYIGPVLTQALSLPDVGGKKIRVSAVMSSMFHPPGNTIAFQVEYLDRLNATQRVTILNPSNDTITNLTNISADYVFPNDAMKLTKFLVTKTYSGEFILQSVSVNMGLFPEIVVEQPVGSSLIDGTAKKSFGTVLVGGSSTAKTFSIKNGGAAVLTGLAITKNGLNPSNFVITPLATISLAPGASTTFKVTFKPSAAGTRSAAIHIKSNDANENPFDIQLGGLGAIP